MGKTNDETEILIALAQKVKKLLEKEPTSRNEFKAWYDEAETFRREVKQFDNDRLPHFVWHYLDDADIRIKDEKYKKEQQRRIWNII